MLKNPKQSFSDFFGIVRFFSKLFQPIGYPFNCFDIRQAWMLKIWKGLSLVLNVAAFTVKDYNPTWAGCLPDGSQMLTTINILSEPSALISVDRLKLWKTKHWKTACVRLHLDFLSQHTCMSAICPLKIQINVIFFAFSLWIGCSWASNVSHCRIFWGGNYLAGQRTSCCCMERTYQSSFLLLLLKVSFHRSTDESLKTLAVRNDIIFWILTDYFEQKGLSSDFRNYQTFLGLGSDLKPGTS